MKKIIRCLPDRYSLLRIILIVGLLFANLAQAKNYTIDQLPKLEADPIHEVVARRVTNYFTQSHFRSFDLDGAFSSKIFDRYFKLLDSNKSIFIKTDLDQFREKQSHLGQNLRQGDVQTAFDIYNLSLKKRFERYQYALALLAEPMNLTIDESIDFNREDIAWPTTEDELNDFWRKRVKYDQLSLALTGKNDVMAWLIRDGIKGLLRFVEEQKRKDNSNE